MTRRKGRKNRSLRSRLRRQRGGQIPAKSFRDWIVAVVDTGLLGKSDTPFSAIKQEALSIPAADQQSEDAFLVPGLIVKTDINKLVDYRVLAAQLSGNDLLFNTVLYNNKSPADFTESVRTMTDKESLGQLLEYENALRVQADRTTITDLADTTAYPLMIWFLALNYVGDPDAALPALISQEEVTKRLSSFTEPAPSEPEVQLP